MYNKNDTRTLALFQYRAKRLQQLIDGTTPDLSQEPDVDLIDLQDYKFVVGEQIEIYQKKNDRLGFY